MEQESAAISIRIQNLELKILQEQWTHIFYETQFWALPLAH